MKVGKQLQDNKENIQKRIENCDDILYRPMFLGTRGDTECFLIYIEVAASNMMLADSVIGKMLNRFMEMEHEQILEAVEKNTLGISDTKLLETMEESLLAMLAGNVVMFVDGLDKAIKISSKGYPGTGVYKAESEKVLRGSKEAFSESVKVNTSLLRKRIRDTRLKVKEQILGEHSNTTIATVYMEDIVYPGILSSLDKKLQGFSADSIMDSGTIEELTKERKKCLLPLCQATERPDRAAQALLEGRVVVVCDHSPEVLIFPTTLNSLFQTSDDYYRHFIIVSFLRVIRYLAAFLAISLPGLYLLAVNFHPQLLPVNLLFSLAKAREGVPFPALIEVLLMELSFELMREAGLRMPGPIGNTIGIVGGLIIGQAAVTANIVSPIAVVIVALTALGSFSVPNEELSESFRLLKYVMIGMSAAFGLLGFFMGWFCLVVYMAGLNSLGISYLAPYGSKDINKGKDWMDSLFRGPLESLNRRPVYAVKENRVRFRRENKGK